MRRQRRLALGVLLGAGALAVIAFPFRTSWWGGWILAIAEAGIVGGLARHMYRGGPILIEFTAVLLIWLAAWHMYRQRIFVRV